METCPVCHKGTGSQLQETHVDQGTEYTLFECSACDIQYWKPFKNPGAEWYSHDPRYEGRNNDPILEPNWNHRKIISFLAPLKGKVLDVGCGVGNFLNHARACGWEIRGIDFDPDAIATAEKVFHLGGLEVSDLAGYRQKHADEHFDLVTFFDVLEHIDDHDDFMGIVRAILKDSGSIAMSMPYRGARWLQPHDLPPRHLTRWNKSALRKFLERQGFEIVYMTRMTGGIGFIVTKLRFKYGKKLSFGFVEKVKRREGIDSPVATQQIPFKVRLAKIAARTKDIVVFGLPALIIWIAMLPTSQRYTTLYAIARKKPGL